MLTMAVDSVGAGSSLLAQRLQAQLKQDRQEHSELNKTLEVGLNSGSVSGDRAARGVERVEGVEQGAEARLERRGEQSIKANAADRSALDEQRASVTTTGVTAEGEIGSGVDNRRLEEQRVLQSEVQAEQTPNEAQQTVQLERRTVGREQQAQTAEVRRSEAQEQQQQVVSRRTAADAGKVAESQALREQQGFIDNIRAQRRQADSLDDQKLQARRVEGGVQEHAAELRVASRQQSAEIDQLAAVRQRNTQVADQQAQEQEQVVNSEVTRREQQSSAVSSDHDRKQDQDGSHAIVEQRRQESPDALTRRANATTFGREQATQTLENLTNSNG
ncbi:hypothetical protein Psal071_00316 [Piscirickettsia salmonis]|uniref:Uncharacterized protein n=1 Tax=Piscirickettsia salmonis TaxID=1238 RepID=A0A9Q6LR19_PISSA|nr:hypothetical protein Psal009_00316 [Piscirickettsia salmonis]QGO33019.1 hypothetical protein Psal028_00317 [Piscirickettsia salmonis]QGO36631.1 hypothetical protein Psal040_00317 [Piscirickettsia salmonis]QGO40255.1 hypothetical protein Psal041_00316 [Piscirickettsia salmonis]QGO43818.1 hypothetical protein Psal051_00317 [Piscirickettsia salmonis]